MPVCFRNVQLINRGNSAIAAGRVVVGDSQGSVVVGADGAVQHPFVPTLVGSAPDVDSCDAVALTGAEFIKLMSSSTVQVNAWQELGNMSIENANVISAYVALVWAIAWGFRAVRSSISNYESKENE